MTLGERLTPRNTEELKPGLFIQKRGNNYRQIEPLAWDGKMRWKKQIQTVFSIRTIISIGIVVFIAWAYLQDTSELQKFNQYVIDNPAEYCAQALEVLAQGNKNLDATNYNNIEVNNGYSDYVSSDT